MTKELLLTACVALISLSAKAQVIQPKAQSQRPAAALFDVTALRPEAETPAKAPARATSDDSAESIYGSWIRCEHIERDDMLTCYHDTLTAPAEGAFGNVRMMFSPDTYGNGQLDGDVLTFSLQYANDGKEFEDVGSRLVLCGVKADRQSVTKNIVFVRNDEGNFVLADSLSGWYIYVEEGDFKHMKWWLSYDTELKKANGLMTSMRTWWFQTMPDTVPVCIVENDTEWDIYGWGPQAKVTVEVDPLEGKTVVQLPQNIANTGESNWEKEIGKYVMLCTKKLEGTYEPGDILWDQTEHEVMGVCRQDGDDTVLEYPEITFGTYSNFANEEIDGVVYPMGVSCGDYADVIIRRYGHTTNAISTVEQTAKPRAQRHAYNLAGQRVSDDYRGIVIEDGVKRLRR